VHTHTHTRCRGFSGHHALQILFYVRSTPIRNGWIRSWIDVYI